MTDPPFRFNPHRRHGRYHPWHGCHTPGTDAGFHSIRVGRHMVRRWAIAAALAASGGALAQPWPAVTPASSAPEPQYVIRTAGQSDRTIKVVRAADPADPASLTEVKDNATGEVFSIPGRMLAKLPKAGQPQPAPAAAAIPPTEPKPAQQTPPQRTPPAELPPVPQHLQAKLVTPKPTAPTTERMITTWRADDPTTPPAQPTIKPVVQTVAEAPAKAPPSVDLWRATGEAKPLTPTPPPAAVGPKLTPVPTWRATPTTPLPNDPWRPSGN